MPDMLPPARFTANPHRHLLPAGTRLWRVHPRGKRATTFTTRPIVADIGGGRFDGTPEDPYPTYYAGLDARTALAEKFLRDDRFSDSDIRTVRRKLVAGQRASVVETMVDLFLVSLLDEESLTAVAATQWLIHAEAADYPATRRWARWIRVQAPWAQGLIWPSKRRAGKISIVLFGDRCADGVVSADSSSGFDLDGVIGAEWINALLAPSRAWIAPLR